MFMYEFMLEIHYITMFFKCYKFWSRFVHDEHMISLHETKSDSAYTTESQNRTKTFALRQISISNIEICCLTWFFFAIEFYFRGTYLLLNIRKNACS